VKFAPLAIQNAKLLLKPKSLNKVKKLYNHPDNIISAIKSFPRAPLLSQRTPLERLPNLTNYLSKRENNVINLYIKRDDLTSLAMGGNKARPLEFILGEAISQECDQIIITGAVQSNYCRSAAAAAAKLGLDCHIQLENRVSGMDSTYHRNGNVLLYKLFGAKTSFFSEGENESAADNSLLEISKYYQSIGKKPYIIKLSPDNDPISALGYVDGIKEIIIQCKKQNLKLDGIVTASGTASTQAGILAGLALEKLKIPVFGICVRRNKVEQRARVKKVTNKLLKIMNSNVTINDEDIHTDDRWLAEGYGTISQEVLDAIKLSARTDGILTDPTYSGKSIAGLIGMTREKSFEENSNILFVHTGGQPNIFAYESLLAGDTE